MNWREVLPKNVLDQMLPHKTNPNYKRPSFMDIFAEILLVMAKRSSCLFAEIGGIIIDEEENRIIASGYNGPPAGCDNCYEVGCARIENGEIKKGGGRCRGLHGELNVFLHATKYGIKTKGLSMVASFKPCFECSKMISNSGLKRIYYLFEYKRVGEDTRPEEILKKAKIETIHYRSAYLEELSDYKRIAKVLENF